MTNNKDILIKAMKDINDAAEALGLCKLAVIFDNTEHLVGIFMGDNDVLESGLDALLEEFPEYDVDIYSKPEITN